MVSATRLSSRISQTPLGRSVSVSPQEIPAPGPGLGKLHLLRDPTPVPTLCFRQPPRAPATRQRYPASTFQPGTRHLGTQARCACLFKRDRARSKARRGGKAVAGGRLLQRRAWAGTRLGAGSGLGGGTDSLVRCRALQSSRCRAPVRHPATHPAVGTLGPRLCKAPKVNPPRPAAV